MEITEIVEITEIEIEFVVQKLSNCLNPLLLLRFTHSLTMPLHGW